MNSFASLDATDGISQTNLRSRLPLLRRHLIVDEDEAAVTDLLRAQTSSEERLTFQVAVDSFKIVFQPESYDYFIRTDRAAATALNAEIDKKSERALALFAGTEEDSEGNANVALNGDETAEAEADAAAAAQLLQGQENGGAGTTALTPPRSEQDAVDVPEVEMAAAEEPSLDDRADSAQRSGHIEEPAAQATTADDKMEQDAEEVKHTAAADDAEQQKGDDDVAMGEADV